LLLRPRAARPTSVPYIKRKRFCDITYFDRISCWKLPPNGSLFICKHVHSVACNNNLACHTNDLSIVFAIDINCYERCCNATLLTQLCSHSRNRDGNYFSCYVGASGGATKTNRLENQFEWKHKYTAFETVRVDFVHQQMFLEISLFQVLGICV